MNVEGLIELLGTFPPKMDVVIDLYSEHKIVDSSGVYTIKGCPKRPDGWVHSIRGDTIPVEYLLIS